KTPLRRAGDLRLTGDVIATIEPDDLDHDEVAVCPESAGGAVSPGGPGPGADRRAGAARRHSGAVPGTVVRDLAPRRAAAFTTGREGWLQLRSPGERDHGAGARGTPRRNNRPRRDGRLCRGGGCGARSPVRVDGR